MILNDPDRISCRPSDAESTGLIDNINATIVDAETVQWDYAGTRNEYIPALKVVFQPDNTEEHHDQYYSAGSLDRLVPSDDGTGFKKAKGSSARSLSETCNLRIFLRSLTDLKFPEEKTDNLKSLIGLHGHFERVPQQERRGLEKKDDRKRTLLVCTSIDKMPWEGKVNKGVSAPAAAPVSASVPANGQENLNAAAIAAAVLALKSAASGSIDVTKLGVEAYRKSEDSPFRKEFITYCKSPEFLGQPNLPFEVVGDVVILK